MQGEILAKDQEVAALQRFCVGYIECKDEKSGITITGKTDEPAEHCYISIKRHKTRVLLVCNQGSSHFPDGDMPNALVQMEIPQMLLSCTTSDQSNTIQID